jgi:hypothetical protein
MSKKKGKTQKAVKTPQVKAATEKTAPVKLAPVKEITQVRQGDVMLKKYDGVLPAASMIEPTSGRYVLAQGSATGNHHSVTAAGTTLLKTDDGQLFLAVECDIASLDHIGPSNHHGSIPIPPGVYEVRIAKEYTPQAVRNVND